MLEKFFQTLGKDRSKAAYGLENVSLALQRGAVEILLISKSFAKSNPAEVKTLEESAEKIGSEVFIISTENQDGEQFHNLTKGVGALLRFALE